jgi:hypothetical protein
VKPVKAIWTAYRAALSPRARRRAARVPDETRGTGPALPGFRAVRAHRPGPRGQPYGKLGVSDRAAVAEAFKRGLPASGATQRP